jgi:hypothetical protein
VPLESIVDAAKSVLLGVVSPQPSDPVADRDDVLQDLHLAEKAWRPTVFVQVPGLSVTASM